MRGKLSIALMALAAASLVACGGGGTGGNDPVVMTSIATGTTSPNLTIPVGADYSFTVVADSPDNALSSLSWAVLASGSAPSITPENLNCGVADKVDTPIMNGLVSSVWKCTVTGRAPASLGADAVYSFTATGVNSKGSKATAVSQLTVKAPEGEAALPKVEVIGPVAANAGAVVEYSCEANGGYLATGEAYKFRWESDPVGTSQIQFDNRSLATMKATMPSVADATTFLLSCKVTDSAGKVGIATRAVEVKPAPPVAKVTGADSGTSAGTVSLTCSGEGGYLPSGSDYAYAWTASVADGKSITFDKADAATVTATLPTVAASSSYSASCTVTDKAGRSGNALKTISVTP